MTLEKFRNFPRILFSYFKKLTKIATKLVPKQSNTIVVFLTSAGTAEVLMGITSHSNLVLFSDGAAKF